MKKIFFIVGLMLNLCLLFSENPLKFSTIDHFSIPDGNCEGYYSVSSDAIDGKFYQQYSWSRTIYTNCTNGKITLEYNVMYGLNQYGLRAYIDKTRVIRQGIAFSRMGEKALVHDIIFSTNPELEVKVFVSSPFSPGNFYSTFTREFIFDNTAPTITASESLGSGNIVKTMGSAFTITTSDPIYDRMTVHYYYENQVYKSETISNSPYTIPELSDGRWKIVVDAYDKLNNSSSATYFINVDKTPPNLFDNSKISYAIGPEEQSEINGAIKNVELELSWKGVTDNFSGTKSYSILKYSSSHDRYPQQLSSIVSNPLNSVDEFKNTIKTAELDKEYYFKIVATDVVGNQRFSEFITIKTPLSSNIGNLSLQRESDELFLQKDDVSGNFFFNYKLTAIKPDVLQHRNFKQLAITLEKDKFRNNQFEFDGEYFFTAEKNPATNRYELCNSNNYPNFEISNNVIICKLETQEFKHSGIRFKADVLYSYRKRENNQENNFKIIAESPSNSIVIQNEVLMMCRFNFKQGTNSRFSLYPDGILENNMGTIQESMTFSSNEQIDITLEYLSGLKDLNLQNKDFDDLEFSVFRKEFAYSMDSGGNLSEPSYCGDVIMFRGLSARDLSNKEPPSLSCSYLPNNFEREQIRFNLREFDNSSKFDSSFDICVNGNSQIEFNVGTTSENQIYVPNNLFSTPGRKVIFKKVDPSVPNPFSVGYINQGDEPDWIMIPIITSYDVKALRLKDGISSHAIVQDDGLPNIITFKGDIGAIRNISVYKSLTDKEERTLTIKNTESGKMAGNEVWTGECFIRNKVFTNSYDLTVVGDCLVKAYPYEEINEIFPDYSTISDTSKKELFVDGQLTLHAGAIFETSSFSDSARWEGIYISENSSGLSIIKDGDKKIVISNAIRGLVCAKNATVENFFFRNNVIGLHLFSNSMVKNSLFLNNNLYGIKEDSIDSSDINPVIQNCIFHRDETVSSAYDYYDINFKVLTVDELNGLGANSLNVFENP